MWYVSSGNNAQPQYQRQQHRPTYGTMRAPGGGQFPGQSQSGSVNYYAPPARPKSQNRQPQSQPQSQPRVDQSAAGPSAGGDEQAPPSYNDVIQADHKIQSQD